MRTHSARIFPFPRTPAAHSGTPHSGAAGAPDLPERHAVAQRRFAKLTPREREVMDLIVAGKTSREIAAAKDLSVRTVEGHRRMLFVKLNVTSAAQLVRLALDSRGGDADGKRPAEDQPR